MGKIKRLDNYQKGVLIFMTVMGLVFAVIYFMTISRVGYRYNDAILVPIEENGNTVYSGKIKGEEAQFIVSNDNTVELNYGDKTYGPYTVKEDVTAIPKDKEMGSMTGIEIREGDDILFRGGVKDLGDYYRFYNEDGTSDSMLVISYVTSDGIERDGNGNPIDKMKPSISNIYELVEGPELTHKGIGFMWFIAMFVCILNALSIVFADELFRLNLAFQIRNVEQAEPSEWELTGRYIGWSATVIIALVIFIMGLK